MSSYKLRGESPFLYDTNNRIVGLQHPDGTEDIFEFVRDATSAPVSGAKATLTTDFTNANADITLTAVDYGTAGNKISVTYVDPSANDAELAVTISGKDISVSLATDGSGTITSTANEVKAALDAVAAVAALVAVAVEGTGLGVVNAKAEASLSGGTNVTEGVSRSASIWNTTTGVRYVKSADQTWVADLAAQIPDAEVVGAPVAVKAIVADVDASAGGTAETAAVGSVPAGSILLAVLQEVQAAFDGDTTTTIDVGVDGTTDKYSAVALDPSSVAGTQVCNPAVAAASGGPFEYLAAATAVIATWTNTASASAGKVRVTLLYI